MSYKNLDDEIVQAEAREASESRQARREPPTYHLGGPPEPWERSLGDAAERVGRQGRAVIEYAARMNAMGIQEKSLAGNVNPIADHVASIGRDKMRLLPGASVLSERKTTALEGAAKNPDPNGEEEDASASSGEISEFSDYQITESPRVGSKAATAATSLEPGNGQDKSYDDDINLINDTKIRYAVEDFDSTNWTTDKLEFNCQTLLEECYASEDRRRRLLSAGMLRKLVEVYPTALRWMKRNLEAVINDGLPSMIKGILGPRVFKLDIMLGVLAPVMSESMTQLNVMARVLRLMLFRMDMAVRVILFRYNLPKELAQCRNLPNIVAAHRRMTLLMQGSALRARWKKVNTNEKHGSLPSSLLHAYLCIILALVDAETCPKFFRLNRVKMVGGGGLLTLTSHLKAGTRSLRLSCRILRELACEPLLIYELLRAGVAEYFSHLLPKLRESSVDKLLEALETLDSMAFSAIRFCALSSENNSGENDTLTLVNFLEVDGNSIGGLESEIRLPAGDKVEEMIRSQLGLPRLMATLTGLLEETDVQLYLAGVVILGKLASTVCYHSVLQEVIAYGGRALARLVYGVQSQEEIVPDMSMALFLRLCSRQEGCQGIGASGGSEMLRPLISGRRAQKSPVFLRGLVCAVALAHRGIQGLHSSPTRADLASSPNRPLGLPLPKSGGIGRSAPPKPHYLDLEGNLYKDLVSILDKNYPGPLETVHEMVRMGSLEGTIYFLVRDDDDDDFVEDNRARGGDSRKSGRRNELPRRARTPHYFHLKQRYACLGAIALHGLTVLAGPHPAIFTKATLQYLSYAIQVAYVDLTIGRLAPGVEYPLVFRSIQLACRALAFLATNNESDSCDTVRGKKSNSMSSGRADKSSEGIMDHGPLRRVADSLFSTTAIKEVACMVQMPLRAAWPGENDFMYRHLERTVISAAILIASICPVPAAERDPFTRFIVPQEEKLSLQRCQPLMERLVNTVGGPLCSTLMVADNLEVIAHACRALSKLSSANNTVQILLNFHELMKAIIRLGPKAPIVLPAVNRNKDEASRDKSDLPSQSGCSHGGRTSNRVIEWQRLFTAESEEARLRPRNLARDREHSEQSRKKVQGNPHVRLRWGGYEIREGRIEDTTMRKLCSLPFDYFRLVANIARIPSGRRLIQSSGTLKRCLERLSLEVQGSSAAQLTTLRCRSEICVVVARMAGTGAANDFILCPRYRALRVMLGMLSSSHDRLFSSGYDRMVLDIARHNAAYALAELCKDMLKAVPLVAQVGGMSLARALAKEVSSPMPLLKHVLRIIRAAASYPGGVYVSSVVDAGLLRAMHRIANNAYPSYRPSAMIEKESSSSSATTKNGIQTRQRQSIFLDISGAKPRHDELLPLAAAEIGKPSSPEAQQISKLAQDVAYLLGSAGPSGASLSESSCEAKMSKVGRKASFLMETVSHQCQEDTKEGVDAARPLKTPQEAMIWARDEQMEQGEAIAEFPNPPDMSGGTAGIFASGRSGTYLRCGVTSCGGLGFVGDHSDTVRVPRFSSVDREVQDGEPRGGGDGNAVVESSAPGGVDSGTTDRSASKAKAGRQGVQVEADQALSPSAPRDVMVTPLALLRERKAGFQMELIRRKECHGLGSTRQGVPVERMCRNLPSKAGEGTRSVVQIEGIYRVLQPQSGEAMTTAGCEARAKTEGGDSEGAPRYAWRGQGTSCFPIDVMESPVMASTRPKAVLTVPPRTVYDRDLLKTEVDTSPVQKKKNDAGKEFVKFARPAAHWSITCALGRKPGMPIRGKGLRLPGGSNGDVVGRFACRGYLLDPIFVDQNPVILHPRLPQISDEGGDGFSQVPDNSTLAELVSSIKRAAAGRTGVGIEPYRNVVEVLHHEVGVSGDSRAAERRFFDECGQPLFPVKFHRVYGSVENRKRGHTEPHLIPFP